MKKSFALILCLFFVISIALVTCVAFIPMNVTQVASAQVSAFTATYFYRWDPTVNYALNSGYVGNWFCDMYGSVIAYANLSEDPDDLYHYVLCTGSGSTSSGSNYYLVFQQSLTPGEFTVGDVRYQLYHGSNVYRYVYDNGAWVNNESGTQNFYYASFFDNLGFDVSVTGSNQICNALKDNSLSVSSKILQPSSDAPVFSADGITFNYSPAIYNGDHGFSGASDDFSVFSLTGFEIENASGHENQYDEVYVDITFYFVGNPQSSVYSIPLLAYDNKYYLALTIPFNDQEHLLPIIPAGYEPVRLTVKFHDGVDSITIAPFGNNRSDIFSAYRQNYWTTLSNGSYVMGFNAGIEYGAESAEGNNLLNLIWNVFQMPFTLLFGTYNNTSHTYDGGLFNLTILGLDIRAFILSVLSVCIVIACIKLILGVRGSTNG